MSIAAILLGWTKLPQWVKELILVLIVCAAAVGVLKVHDHTVFESGIHAQQAADAKKAAADLAVEQKAKLAAEQAYAQSQKDLVKYIADNPLQPVRLCLNKIILSAPKAPTTAAGSVLQVPAGDSGSGAGPVGPDISAMLNALGEAADRVTADYRSQTP